MKQELGRSLIGVASVIGLVATNCSFLLDFDEFETCARCADVKPCDATQWCIDNQCSADPSDLLECQEPAPQVFKRCGSVTSGDAGTAGGARLVAGHLLAELSADSIGKTQILVGANFIYHVAYVENAGQADIVLRAFALGQLDAEPTAAQMLRPMQTRRVSEFLEDESVRSPASITLDRQNRVVLYVAQGSADRTVETATLSRLVLGEDLTSASTPKLERLTDPPNYRISDDYARVGPEAGFLDSREPFVAWQGCKSDVFQPDAFEDWCKDVANEQGGSAIFTHVGGERLNFERLLQIGVEEPLAVSALQTLSGGSYSGAVWGTTTTDNEVVIRAGVPDSPNADDGSLGLLQCENSPGRYVLNSIRATPSYNGKSSIVWSKRQPNGASVTEAASAGCSEQKCLDDVNPDEDPLVQCDSALFQRRVFSSVRAAAHGVWLVDPEHTDQAIIVSAKLEELGDETRLTLAQDLGSPNPNQSPFLDRQGDELTLAEGTPDWPELHLQTRTHQKVDAAYAVVGVGWVEKAGGKSDGKDVAKLQTYDLCFGE